MSDKDGDPLARQAKSVAPGWEPDGQQSVLDAGRRNLLSTTETVLTSEWDVEDRRQPSGPVLVAWQEWSRAWQQTMYLCLRQQSLERKMLDVVGGFPSVDIYPDGDIAVQAQFDSDIDHWLPGDSRVEERARAREELAAKHQRWNEADEDIGFEAALLREGESAADAHDLAALLWSLPSSSPADVIAKLHALLSMEQPTVGIAEDPWPQLQIILDDLLGLLPKSAFGNPSADAF